jgi:hypothetical protein
MKKYILGLIVGASSLGLAIPLFVQAASSSSGSTTSKPASFNPTQACVQAMAARDENRLSNFDVVMQAEKTALQTRKNALTAAAAITDDVQRKDAVKKANDDFRAAMKTVMDQTKTAQQTTMETIRTACGRGGGMFGGEGLGPMMDKGDFGGFGRGEKHEGKEGRGRGPEAKNEGSSTSSAE